ncbi:MAG: hypothetical protein DCC75_02345, partial [Proteobacteria bacterium]
RHRRRGEAGRKATHGDKEKSSSSTTVSRSGGESESSQGSEDLISRLGRLITRTTFKAKAGEDVSGQDDYGTSLDRDPAAGNTGADSTFSKAGYQGGQESEEQIDDHQPQRPRNREEQGQEREKKGFFKQRSQKEGTTEETARAEGSGFFDDLSKKEQRKFRQLSPAEAILEAAEKCMEIFQVFTDAELRKTRSKAVFTSGTFPWRAIFTWIFVITLVLAAGFCAVAFWPEQPIAANNVEPRVRDVNSPDTIPPEAPVIISPGNNSRLKRNLQMVYGISEARSWVTLYNGETLLGRSLTDDKMVWSISPTPELGPGRYSLHAVAEDQAGNLSGPSRINKVQVLERSPKVVSPTSHKAKSGPSGD